MNCWQRASAIKQRAQPRDSGIILTAETFVRAIGQFAKKRSARGQQFWRERIDYADPLTRDDSVTEPNRAS